MSLPPRWQQLVAFFQVLLDPLLSLERRGLFAVEANGPDGGKWTDLRPRFIDLPSEAPALALARVVAQLCGAIPDHLDPGPKLQQRRGIYYAPCSLLAPRRIDQCAHALAAIVLDIDDRNHGGRAGTLAALSNAPEPTFLVHSGGGVQAGYVLREAIVFERSDPAALAEAVRAYLEAALALQALTAADATAWPSHLFRCPGAYHLKDPSRPVLVTADLRPDRRFNLEDFEEFLGLVDGAALASARVALLDRLEGVRRKAPLVPAPIGAVAGPGGVRRVVLPRRVSPQMVGLLNGHGHDKYLRPDGTLDRSRATFAVAISLLAAGIEPERVVSMLRASALRPAADDRGAYGETWLVNQVQAAQRYVASQRGGARQ